MRVIDNRKKKDSNIGIGDIITHKRNGGLYLIVITDDKEYPVSIIDLMTYKEHNAFGTVEDIKISSYDLVAKSYEIELVIGGDKA